MRGGGWWRAPVPLLVLCALAGCSSWPTKTLEGIEGEDVVLRPVFQGTQTEIVWKQAEDKVAEWNGTYVQYYRTWGDRAELNSQSGSLTIKKVSEKDAGKFKAEVIIGTSYQYTFFTLSVFKPPAPPTLSCNASEDFLQLNCTPANQPLPNLTLSYSWKFPDKQEILGREPSLQLRKDTNLRERITCSIRISTSAASTSFPLADCDSQVPAASSRIHTGAIVAVLLLLPLLVLAGFVLWKSGTLARCTDRIRMRQQGPGQQRAAASGDLEEGQPLNTSKPEGVAESLEAGRDPPNGLSAKSASGRRLVGNGEDGPQQDSGASLEHERDPVSGQKPEELEGRDRGVEGQIRVSSESSPQLQKDLEH